MMLPDPADLRRWLAHDPDPRARRALQAAIEKGDAARLHAWFVPRLNFGTAGLRAPLGIGPRHMNRLTVRYVAAGLGAFLGGGRVLIGYDARPHGRQFAADAAGVLAALGLAVWLFPAPTATPVLAFGVRHLRLDAGIMVTASHNPAGDQGLKIFGPAGAQYAGAPEARLASAVQQAARRAPPWLPARRATQLGRRHLVPGEVADAYRQHIVPPPTLQVAAHVKPLTVAYSALHGVGGAWVCEALAHGPFVVHPVAAQQQPDGRFPTAANPNPEHPAALAAVLQLAQHCRADLVMVNDPDADRLAVAVPHGTGYRRLTGNEIGLLLADWLSERLPRPLGMGTTCVSTQLLRRLCRARDVEYFETLTGFKWLACGAQALRQRGVVCALSFEEALGFCVGDAAVDKDGIAALLWLAHLAAHEKSRRRGLLDRLWKIYREVGLAVSGQQTFALPVGGRPGAGDLGSQLRRAVPLAIAGRAVLHVQDLLAPHAARPAGAPPTDLLIYTLAGGARVVVRPSGTEPKMKCYYELTVDVPQGTAMPVAEQRGLVELEKLMGTHRQDVQQRMVTPS